MPVLCSQSTVRTRSDDLLLSLTASHRLHVGNGGTKDTSYGLRGVLPASIDVCLESELVISICYISNRVRVPARDIKHSAPAVLLIRCLKQVRDSLPAVRLVFQCQCLDESERIKAGLKQYFRGVRR
jgi:hypothetical protein